MTEHEKLPAELTPINLLAYLYNAFGACGCSEQAEMCRSILHLLTWMDGDKQTHYETLYPEVGVFYLLAGRLDDLGLCEHGTSIRFPWLTEDGKRLLTALSTTNHDEIEASSGEAYDGLSYGMG